MENFELYLPTRHVFGSGVENEVGARLKQLGMDRVLLHYGGGSAERSGLLGRVRRSLDAAGIYYVELGGVAPNPRLDLALRGLELVRAENLGGLLAVGGGSAIDSAKCIAMGACYDGDVWDFYSGKAQPQTALPVACVLTIPAAGSESSNSSVISRVDANGTVWKRGAGSELIRPVLALMNPELTWTLPPSQTANGVADIFTHVTERYFTNSTGTYLVDQFCEGILRTLVRYAPLVIADPCHAEGRAQIMWAGALAHNNLVGVGRVQDWASHQIEHELSAVYDVAHGAGLAVVLPAWMRFVYRHDLARFVRFATTVFGVENDPFDPEGVALAGIRRLVDFYRSIGLGTSFAEIGGKVEDIDRLISGIRWDAEGQLGNFVKLGPAEVREIYRLMHRS
ncbi:MAG: iron-containing alcohol dehydrogenase [Bacillota bacterium]|nr:iron-containing alcohol dehydrogenase [Bacillota bacterium]